MTGALWGLGRTVSSGRRALRKFITHAWVASSMYFTVQEVALDCMIGEGRGKGRGTLGLSNAPLNLIMKKNNQEKRPGEKIQAKISLRNELHEI